MKVIHIHSDRKFVRASYRDYADEVFDNVIVIWGNKTNYAFPNQESAHYFNHTKADLYKIAAFCQGADVVVLYNLDTWKAALVNLLPEKAVILWRFFGNELYAKIPTAVHSETTLKLKNKHKSIFKVLIEKAKRFKALFNNNIHLSNNEFKKAISRINYFMGMMDLEHKMLKSYIPELPSFVQLPMVYKNPDKLFKNDRETIILGNSRNAVNNHMDILFLIQKNNNNKYKFLLPFNYGEKSAYTDKVKEVAQKIHNLTLLEEFYEALEYYEILKSCSALVINSYRQNALGSIFHAISTGLKLYLNESNVVYGYLKSKGFKVFSIAEFEDDLTTGNISLTETDKISNLNTYNELVDHCNHTFKTFLQELVV